MFDHLVKALTFILIVAGAMFALNVHELLGFAMFPQQFYGLVLAIILFVIFLVFPVYAEQDRNRLPWYDVIFATLGFACGVYLIVWYPKLAYDIGSLTPDKVIMGSIAVVLVIEASRRIYGWILPGITIAFVLYALFADKFPGLLETRPVPWNRMAVGLFLSEEGILGIAMAIVSTIVLVFILFGQLLFAMGGGTVFTDLASSMLGRYRGGPAKVAVVGSALFGSISGSAVANVAITGSVTIPMMKRIGYRAEVAGAIEATASTGGLVTPPVMSAVAFLMAELLSMSYGKIIIAAAIPAVLYYAAILIQVDLEAGRTGMKGLPKEEIPRILDVLKRGWPYLIPVPILVYTLVELLWQPAKSGMFSVLVLVVCGFWFVRKKTPKWWYNLLAQVGLSVTEILAIAGLIGIILAAASSTGLSFTLSLPLIVLGEINLFLLLLATSVISIILGMGLPGIAIYFMQVTLIVPALVELGIMPIAAHFFIYYFGVFSMITPPVCISAIAAAGIAQARPMVTGWESVKLGIVAFIVPFVFVFSPSLLAQGALWLIVLNFCLSCIGVVAASVGLRGYFAGPVSWPMRSVSFIAALALFVPVTEFTGIEILFNLGGLALAGLCIGTNLVSARRALLNRAE
jgi:TRAP transporter 4TM/12TM fusion protein